MLAFVVALGLGLLGQADTSPHSQASLVSSVNQFRPGEPFVVAIRLKQDPGWHSYWKNPGDSGMPTTVAWTLPRGWRAEPIMWPIPHPLESSGVVAYGYDGEVRFLTRLVPPANSKTAKLQADVSWLICSDTCLPASEKVQLTLTPSRQSVPNAFWAKRLIGEHQRLNEFYRDAGVFRAQRGKGVVRLTEMTGQAFDSATWMPEQTGLFTHELASQVEVDGPYRHVVIKDSPYAAKPTQRLRGILRMVRSNDVSHTFVDIPILPENQS
jgi:DsbC/DsbD-like thiol-disulfide interchange protein